MPLRRGEMPAGGQFRPAWLFSACNPFDLPLNAYYNRFQSFALPGSPAEVGRFPDALSPPANPGDWLTPLWRNGSAVDL